MTESDITVVNDNYICCFTGHRSIAVENIDKMSALVDSILDMLISQGVTQFRTGGAVGFDTLAALKIIEKKKNNPHIQLHLILPCKNQSESWNELCQKIYSYTLEAADSITYISDTYVSGCMLKRNRSLVDGSQFCVAYCISEDGGSAYTLNYAKKQGLRTINVATML